MGRSAIVLAAGHGSRMKSKTHKVLHSVCGKPMILHILDTLNSMDLDQVIVVVGQQRESVMEAIASRADIAIQEEQLGTGDAVRAALPLLRQDIDSAVVLYGDAPLIQAQTLEGLFAHRQTTGADAVALTARVTNPTGLGRVFLDESGQVTRVVEEKDASPEERLHTLINTGIYAYGVDALKSACEKLDNNNAQGEYYLTDTLAIMRGLGQKVVTVEISDVDEIASVNDRLQLSQVEKLCRRRIVEKWMREGVTIIDPDTTYIEADVTIGRDVILHHGTMLAGATTVAEDAQIGPNTRLLNTQVGVGATVTYAVAQDSKIGDEAQVGPFAYLRPGADIGKRVKVGDFVEVKNSEIGDDTKISHLAYVGDASIGTGVNMGCGVITVNYDGKRKNRTVVGNDSFIGSNVNLIAPVTIGEGAYVCAGSTVTNEVPDDAFVIGRPEQVTKPNYVRSWKLRKEQQSSSEGGEKRGN